MSDTFTITSVTDWHSAITDSNSATPVYEAYELSTDITFTSTNKATIGTGTQNADYLFIGANKIFNGNGYRITIKEGGYATDGLAGILRAGGSSAEACATIKNVEIYVESNVAYQNGSGAALVSDCGDTGSGYQYIRFENILMTNDAVLIGPMAFLYNWWNAPGNYLTFYNITVINKSDLYDQAAGLMAGNGWENMADGIFSPKGCTFENIFYKGTSVSGEHTSILAGFNSRVEDCTISNVYIVLDSAASAPPLIGTQALGSTVCQNIYTVFGDKNSTSTGGSQLFYASSDTVTISNYYTNYTGATNYLLTSVPDSTVTASNINPGFVWGTAATLGSGFDTAKAPYRLNAFLTSPFSPLAYNTYSCTPAFALKDKSTVTTALTHYVGSLTVQLKSSDPTVNSITATLSDLNYSSSSGTAYLTGITQSGVVTRIDFSALDENGNEIHDFASSGGVSIRLQLPMADTSSTLAIYKLDSNTYTYLDPQPTGFPAPLTYDTIYKDWSATLMSFSPHDVVDTTPSASSLGGDPHLINVYGTKITLPNDWEFIRLYERGSVKVVATCAKLDEGYIQGLSTLTRSGEKIFVHESKKLFYLLKNFTYIKEINAFSDDVLCFSLDTIAGNILYDNKEFKCDSPVHSPGLLSLTHMKVYPCVNLKRFILYLRDGDYLTIDVDNTWDDINNVRLYTKLTDFGKCKGEFFTHSEDNHQVTQV